MFFLNFMLCYSVKLPHCGYSGDTTSVHGELEKIIPSISSHKKFKYPKNRIKVGTPYFKILSLS